MQRPASVAAAPPIDTTLTLQDVKDGFRIWAERTSTSPSGRHLGHYKTLLAPTGLPPDSKDPIVGFGDRMMSIHTKLLNLAILTGYCFECWIYVVNCWIEKEAGRPKLDRLRIIHLYEADYNLIGLQPDSQNTMATNGQSCR